jgi:hypothetical protein
MAKQQAPGPADQFSDPEMEAVKQYGQALGGKPTDFDEAVEEHLNRYEEASQKKMRAAQEGGQEIGPSDIEKEQVQQQQGQAKAQAAQGAQQASQAQAQQTPVNAPPAPSGPAGVSTPYPAQNAPQPPPSAQDAEPSVPGMQSPASEVGQSQQPENGD